MCKPDFWDHPQEAQAVLKERTVIQRVLERWQALEEEMEEAETCTQLGEEASDDEMLEEAAELLESIK